jgi:hypothetical protein
MKIRKMPQPVRAPVSDMHYVFRTTGWSRNLHGIYIHPLLGSVYWDNGSVLGYSTDIGWSAELENITYYI